MFNNVTTRNNSFKVHIVDRTSTLATILTHTIRLEVGLFSIDALIDNLNSSWDALTFQVGGGSNLDVLGFTWGFDTITNKLTFNRTLTQSEFPPPYTSTEFEKISVYLSDIKQDSSTSAFKLLGLLMLPTSNVSVSTPTGIVVLPNVTKSMTTSNQIGLEYLGYPNLSGPTVVYVTLKGTGNNFIDANDGTTYQIVGVVSLAKVGFGEVGVFTLKDIFTHDVDFEIGRDISDWEIQLTDAFHNVLELPCNYEVEAVFKIYHTDTKRG